METDDTLISELSNLEFLLRLSHSLGPDAKLLEFEDLVKRPG